MTPLRSCLLPVFCLTAWTAGLVAQTVTVIDGSLGPELTQGQTNHVWADAPGPGRVFDRWTGDVQILADPYAWHTTAVMPAADATITATYRNSAEWVPSSYVVNALPPEDPAAINVVYYFPPEPVGVIFLFHGGGGSAWGWFMNNDENIAFARDAVGAGYAVVALDSSDRTFRTWSNSVDPSNPDVVNVENVISQLTALDLMTATTPKYAVGMSSGGGITPKVAYALDFNASAIWCSPGTPPGLFLITTVPTLWNLAENDTVFSDVMAVQENLQKLTNRSIPGELRINAPSPVYPRRFLRIPELTPEYSQEVYDNLKNGGFLDASDYLINDPTNSNWESVMPTLITPKILNSIRDQLFCCYSGHKFYSDYGNKVLQFFGRFRPAGPGRGAVSNLTINPDGSVQVIVAGDAGQDYRLQVSTTLGGWQTILTVIQVGGTFDWNDSAATEPRRFYRTLSP